MPNELINKVGLYPRCEYYTRFENTTAFRMGNPTFWGSYHRSSATRFFQLAGGKTNVHIDSDCITDEKGYAKYAHTGGIASPYSIPLYLNMLKANRRATKGQANVRDDLLIYKRNISQTIVDSFATYTDNRQKTAKAYQLRPIVYFENKYPCVLVRLPILNIHQQKTEATKYWAKHPQAFQKLLLACLIAQIDRLAIEEGLPIEVVIRASFGHNLPSICETKNTFRINVGLIPQQFAELIGKALHLLNLAINEITDESAKRIKFNEKFYAKIRRHNAEKLQGKIKKYTRYEKLIETRDFRKAAESQEAFERLYAAFCEKNEGKGRAGKSTFKPVIIKGKTVWQVIREVGDTASKSVLSECFRENASVDWFASTVLAKLCNEKELREAIETTLHKMLLYLDYGKTVTLNDNQIRQTLKSRKIQFENPSFLKIYKNDPAFNKITLAIFKAFNAKRPNEGLYAALEYAGVEFISTMKGSVKIAKEADYGSSSDFSDDLTVLCDEVAHRGSDSEPEEFSLDDCEGIDDELVERASYLYPDPSPLDILYAKFDNDWLNEEEKLAKHHIVHRKLRVCAGMKAIVLAHYGALCYLKQNNIRPKTADTEQMYYEVKDALKYIEPPQPVRSRIKQAIIYYDLNHCNSVNAGDNISLEQKLALNAQDEEVFSVIVLDCTSSTHAEIKIALQQCLNYEPIKVVMFVSSGLKNDQGGLDYNPYGEVRIVARDRKTCEFVFAKMKRGLSEDDKLPVKVHESIRACKRRGLATSLSNFFKAPAAIEEKAEKISHYYDDSNPHLKVKN